MHFSGFNDTTGVADNDSVKWLSCKPDTLSNLHTVVPCQPFYRNKSLCQIESPLPTVYNTTHIRNTLMVLISWNSSVGRAADLHVRGPGFNTCSWLRPGLIQPPIPLWVGKMSTKQTYSRMALSTNVDCSLIQSPQGDDSYQGWVSSLLGVRVVNCLWS